MTKEYIPDEKINKKLLRKKIRQLALKDQKLLTKN